MIETSSQLFEVFPTKAKDKTFITALMKSSILVIQESLNSSKISFII